MVKKGQNIPSLAAHSSCSLGGASAKSLGPISLPTFSWLYIHNHAIIIFLIFLRVCLKSIHLCSLEGKNSDQA